MSRLDKFEEILNSYEGRKYTSDYIPSENDIKRIHKCVAGKERFMDSDTPKLFYIACKNDALKKLMYVNALDDLLDDQTGHSCISIIKNVSKLDFTGVVCYTADLHPVEFIQNEKPSKKKLVPSAVEVPDLMLILDKRGNYIMFKGDETYDNLMENSGVTGS